MLSISIRIGFLIASMKVKTFPSCVMLSEPSTPFSLITIYVCPFTVDNGMDGIRISSNIRMVFFSFIFFKLVCLDEL